MYAKREKTSRRALLIAGAAVFAVWGGGAAIRSVRARSLEFEPIEDLPGFRRIAGGAVSSGALSDPLIGLDTGRPRPPRVENARICKALFRDLRAGTVPVAAFSDYYCPYCRVLTADLAMRESAGEITVTWHELPLLGESSMVAARAAMAADLQGGYAAFHARLMRAQFQPNPDYLAELSETVGLDPQRLLADMGSDAIAKQLGVSAGVAARFGFFATPALVVGRTAVLGSVPVPRLDALIAHEAKSGDFCA